MPPRAVAAFFPGHVADGSFMQAGHDGIAAACRAAGLPLSVTQAIPLGALAAAMARAAPEAGLVIAQGGQCDEAAGAVAPRFPATRFVVVQGHAAGGNLYAYRAAQEQSAFLAGAAAALLLPDRAIGHISGIRPRPGLLARAAFAAGIAHVAPGRRLLSIFTGDQDDRALGAAAAERLADAGVGLVFTMLNAAQAAVVDVARQRGMMLAGDGKDWVADRPDAFALAAVAESGEAGAAAVRDYADGARPDGKEVVFGLDSPGVVRLSCGVAVRDRLAALEREIVVGRIDVTAGGVVEELA